jgi:hypothetical protein
LCISIGVGIIGFDTHKDTYFLRHTENPMPFFIKYRYFLELAKFKYIIICKGNALILNKQIFIPPNKALKLFM